MPKLNSKPEPIEIDLAHAAVLVVDMQNAFASRGGMLDLAGVDISGASCVAQNIRNVLDVARRAGVLIVYLQMGYNAELSNAGGIHSPNYHKELAMHLMKSRSELKGKLLTEDTWDFAIVEELQPQAGDIVVRKTRYTAVLWALPWIRSCAVVPSGIYSFWASRPTCVSNPRCATPISLTIGRS